MMVPPQLPVIDFTEGYDIEAIRRARWAVGRYNENRSGMYTAPQYENRRTVHMGIDIWAPEGEAVYAVAEGRVAYLHNHRERGNYGPTLVLHHRFGNLDIYALHGHLNQRSILRWNPGDRVEKGEEIANLGAIEENGGWEPHLHYQISWDDPGEADMPGVVAPEEREEALNRYPDPRIIVGTLY
ncbi:MAG: peptidoglycan DD-metalloendopeptidase family protein [Balneolaceae bacterium]